MTPEQERAASFYGSHARLLSGPGTGKTLSLTRRILFLIEEVGIHPSLITALTFTRAAASELKKRVEQELEDPGNIPRMSTLHSFALSMILRNPTRTRLPLPLRIADDYEERWIIKEELKGILRLERLTRVEKLLHQLSADWQTLTADEDRWEQRFPNPEFLGAWQEHREVYGYTLRAELVYQLKLALEEEDFEFGIPIEHLLVDEYQDLNPCDLAVMKHLTSHGAELFCAGDDDQSIYGFRHANPVGIRRFTREYSPSESLELETCMRCDRRILDLGLYVASQDPRRVSKNLHCQEDAGEGEVRILRFGGQRQEANGISRICEWLINNQGTNPSKILILLRSDRNRIFSSLIYGSLHDRHIPVTIAANPLAPLQTEEGRHFLCLLHLLANRRDNLAWRTMLKIRRNGIGDKTLKHIYEIARTGGQTFSEALEQVDRNPELIPRKGNRIRHEVHEIREVLDGASVESYDGLSDFVEAFANDQIDDNSTRMRVVSLFQNVAEMTNETDLGKLLRAVNVSLKDEEQDRQEGHVSIMTMHQAKGLSADAVIIAAAEDEYIPGRAQGEQVEDERRLLYVSLTRARHNLYLTRCRMRTGRQRHSGRTSGSRRRTLSRFLSGGPVQSMDGTVYINSLHNEH